MRATRRGPSARCCIGNYHGKPLLISTSENADDLDVDDEGVEFNTFEHACSEADRALRKIAVDARAQTLWMSVFDADRKLLHRARLGVITGARESCRP